jgi:hypothetical protein
LTICAIEVPQAAAASTAVRVLCGISRMLIARPAALAAATTRSVLLIRSAIGPPE